MPAKRQPSMRQSSESAFDYQEALKADMRSAMQDLPSGSSVPKSAVRIWARGFVRVVVSFYLSVVRWIVESRVIL
jgi:hypothetical protein